MDSLPARLFLLACEVEKEQLKWGDQLGYAIRAGTLAELAARGCVADDKGRVRAVGGHRTGDPVLDGALRVIAEHPRARRWHTWVQRNAARPASPWRSSWPPPE
ncbi:GPP34 family phosphoprotein [Streptomyces sp. GKU 257-1]|nr:GPP34 family phosphoprotein [Streptomyces sp. GKU 257-1]